ncbi:MAG: hypothetical protein HC836_15565 [Richelia sp. RM2_1_2]|nr:hypothetical protein [Richelia sp. RM2_1_2]
MELIKKKIHQVLSGSTGTPAYSAYTMNILLTTNVKDLGFFDVYDDPLATGATGTTIITTTYPVTGYSKSRLLELRKYTINPDLAIKYRTSVSPTVDGLDLTKSITGSTTGTTLVYYLSGITYHNVTPTGTTGFTVFSFTGVGYNSPNFINKPIYKDEAKENIVVAPIVNPDVFIIRQSLSVFENNYRLKDLKNLTDVLDYAGGGYFNIIENT